MAYLNFPRIVDPSAHLAVHFRMFLELSAQVKTTFASLATGISGSQPLHSASCWNVPIKFSSAEFPSEKIPEFTYFLPEKSDISLPSAFCSSLSDWSFSIFTDLHTCWSITCDWFYTSWEGQWRAVGPQCSCFDTNWMSPTTGSLSNSIHCIPICWLLPFPSNKRCDCSEIEKLKLINFNYYYNFIRKNDNFLWIINFMYLHLERFSYENYQNL